MALKLCCGLQAVNALGHVPVRMPEADMKLTIPLFSLKVGKKVLSPPPSPSDRESLVLSFFLKFQNYCKWQPLA